MSQDVTMDENGCKQIRTVMGGILKDMKTRGQIASYPQNHTYIPFETYLHDGSDESLAIIANHIAAETFYGIKLSFRPKRYPRQIEITIGAL